MFIEQSAARRRAVRFLFLAAGVLPCAALIGAAWWRHSPGHVAAIEREAAVHLGIPVAIGRVAHPRPGLIRISDVIVSGTLQLPEVEVESTPTEVRVRVSSVACPPGAARLLADMVGEWLRRPARFPRSWVVDVGAVAWVSANGGRIEAGGWHVECVAAADARAVRLRREPATADEVRVRSGAGGLTVEGVVEQAVPVAIVAAFAAGDATWGDALGPHAVVRGRLQAARQGDGWIGEASGEIARVDLAAACAGRSGRMQGEATLAIESLAFNESRLERCDLRLSAAGGGLSQEVLDELVSSAGCRPGPAYRALGGDVMRRFDTLGLRVVIDAEGLRIRSLERAGGGVINSQGLTLLHESDVAVPATRLAWFLSPAGRPAVPASAVSGWLISVLPAGRDF